ncbi:Coenzyme PQQ synthesis protein E [Metallosphaera sp. J1]|uniref:radical SAM/SPASM domain-containing protein n=1 Tax=Metallosphaera javensis (ex Hofmann et al. 2022) TaxID=99938 RepID=UPI001EE05622|nr:radical SAM protein [Metallosphaera javensis (ex Hofmann et al. 2022)]MCG3109945.1 Coenzyme PQQ synthesis protein E [Metallosphaera javensis (ex Hofmann et al. 2022)]
MISISRLVSDRKEEADRIRYSGLKDRYPSVLVFNVTRNCNLRCLHCYSGSGTQLFQDLPLSTWINAVKQASEMGVKHILLSGGEPLARRDLHVIAREAWERGIRVELSTNGTMLTRERLEELKPYVDYVGVSLDGPEPIHDKFRGVEGAFSKALKGIRTAKEMGLKTGLRFTITRDNYSYIDFVFEVMRKEGINRVCFYHLAYAGRADRKLDIDNSTRLRVIAKIVDYARTGEWEVLTADNPVDGILVYRLTGKDRVLELLRRNGGNKSGERIADVNPEGVVYPDQFTPVRIGEITDLRRIWDEPHPVVKKLRERKSLVKCASCRFFDVCNGGLRGRALAVTGDMWEKDPSCYLDEIEKLEEKAIA